MGANQTRPADGKRKSKGAKGKKEEAAAATAAAAAATAAATKRNTGHAAQFPHPPAAEHPHAQPAHHTGAAAPQVAPAHAPAGHAAGGLPAVADPDFDDHSHPFHAPLDHVREEERPLHALSAATHFDVGTLRRLQVIFTDIAESDVDDGIIDGNELTDAMGLKPTNLLARTIFRIFDVAHEKKIDFAQWVKTISALSVNASLEEKIKFSFSLYDLNGDGSIDVEELRAMLEAAVKDDNILNLTDAEVSEWCSHTLSQVDGNGDGKVDYQEYKSMVSSSTKFLESFTLDIATLAKSFRFKKGVKGSILAHTGSSEKLTTHEMNQRMHWFRARKRENSIDEGASGDSSSKQDGGDGDSSRSELQPAGSGAGRTQAGSSGTAPAQAAAATTIAAAHPTSGARLNPARDSTRTPPQRPAGSSSHRPLNVATPAPSSATRNVHPPVTASAGAAQPVAVATLRSAHGTHVTLQSMPDSSTPAPASIPSAAAATFSSSSATAAAGLVPQTASQSAASYSASANSSSADGMPNFHDAPSPSATPQGAPEEMPAPAALDAAAHPSSSSSSSSSSSAPRSSAPSSVRIAVDAPASATAGDAPTLHSAASLPTASTTSGSEHPPRLDPNARRQLTAPSSGAAHSAHYVASRTPLHILKQASIATLARDSDEEVEPASGADTPQLLSVARPRTP